MALSKDGRIGTSFYTYDGTWRTAEPSWRLLMAQEENIRGLTSAGFPLPQPKADSNLRGELSARARVPMASAVDPSAAPVADAAAAAAAAYRVLSWKDGKHSGFANEQPTHVSLHEHDPTRWDRLGIMTRGAATGTLHALPDKFGDVRVRRQQAVHRPLRVEPSGYTRGPFAHTSAQLVGGFQYVEPEAVPPLALRAQPNVEAVGSKLASGYRINNAGVVAAPPTAPSHYDRVGVGHAPVHLDQYGDLAPRRCRQPLSLSDSRVVVEPSGYTREKGAHSAVELQGG